jgi:hypothetical protein
MIKIKYEHIYGSQEKHDLQVAKLVLDSSGMEFSEREAVENGWLVHDGEWYQCRSTRIRALTYLEKYKKPTLPKQSVEFYWSNQLTDELKKNIDKIYDDYCHYKNFSKDFKLHVDEDRSGWLVIYDEEIPVAFTKCLFYTTSSMESQYTAWNYHKPSLSIGKKILYYEVLQAQKYTTSEYLYLGQGYENGSLYKADFPGFEWWTGNEWSSNIEKYKELCVRDSNINTLDDLAKAYMDTDAKT